MANAIFIVGYYRSGTSALSGALQHAGVKFYNEADPNEHNPLGFYEIPELIEFDARLFAHLGVDWPDVRGLPDGWVDRPDITPFATQLEDVLRRRFPPQDRLWGLKHPHLCRTLPLYERVARRAGHTPHIIHIFRDPWISAASQCYKNGLSRAHALLLWLTYATNAERQARHLPRCWLTYHELLSDPAGQLRKIEAALGLTLQGPEGGDLAQASAYLTSQLDRSKPLPREQLCNPLERLVDRTWAAIQARQFEAGQWDEFAAETADLVGFLAEIGSSKARALPAFGSPVTATDNGPASKTPPRPAERTDPGARQNLLKLRDATGTLPRVAVLIAAPSGRAHAVAGTLESLRAQWAPPALIKVLTADTLALDDVPVINVGTEAEAVTKALCAQLNDCALEADYVATLNAGDIIAPDGCLRLALLAAQTKADMLYSDEIVPNDGAEIPVLDKWLTALLTGKALTGPIILAGAELSPAMQTYLKAVTAQQDALQGQVLAVTGETQGEALTQALALANTELVTFLDARMQDITPHWQDQLRARLADQGVVAVAARTITPISSNDRQGQITGPIILGADARMGAGHGPLDPGPGGWLVVDQEAIAITPPGLMIRRASLANCRVSTALRGDALWIDLCAQLRAEGARLVWTPDVSIVMPAINGLDTTNTYRTGSPAARALPWADPYHHPALSLHGDPLAAEKRIGLVRPTPANPARLLLTGDVTLAHCLLNAARVLRQEGDLDADWAPGTPTEAELQRCAPAAWVRINPSQPPSTANIPYRAVYTTLPGPDASPALTAAAGIYATSPGLMQALRQQTPSRIPVELWRPALSASIWQAFQPATGLNTKPRVLWIDENMAPPWFQELITETSSLVSWIIITRPGASYTPDATLLPYQETERGWAELLAAVAPQILLRPMDTDTHADCYMTLLAAATGCSLIVDSRLDTPESLQPLRLPPQKPSWMTALNEAVAHLPATLQRGTKTRASALALPTLERSMPGWAMLPSLAKRSVA